MKRFFFCVLTVILMAAVFFAAKLYYEPDTTVVLEAETGVVEEEEIHSARMIRDGLKNMGQLVTQEYYFTQVEQYAEEKKIRDISIPFTQSSYTISYDGTIRAGIDFSAIEVEEEGNKLLITIPEAEILSSELDEDSFVVYDEEQSFFNRIELIDINESRKQLIENAESKALQKGLIEKADQNARILIEHFVNALIEEGRYRIEYVSAG